MAYYSLQNGVGKGQKNDSADVKVVQVLLTKHQYKVKTDGIYTEDLQTSIESFQTEVEKMLVASGTVTAGSTTLSRLEGAMPKSYELAEASLVLSNDILDVIKPLGIRFYCNAIPNMLMTINSGRRTTSSQAGAMYTKLKLGDDLQKLYKNKTAAKEISDAYADAVKAKKSVADVRSAIQAKLDDQVSRGVYISNHLSAKAFDVRNKDMSGAQQTVFQAIAKNYCRLLIKETKPPHFHLELN